MVMRVCLSMYAALEYRLRQALTATSATVPDQKGKPTLRPTMHWIFQFFAGIHVLSAMILNLNLLSCRCTSSWDRPIRRSTPELQGGAERQLQTWENFR